MLTFRTLANCAKALAVDTSGATSVEYALVMGGVFLAVVGAINYYIDQVGNMFDDIANNF